MMRSLYSAVSGLKTHQTRMDVIGNNIANVNTEAFKASRVTFTEIMYQTVSEASAGDETRGKGGINAKQIGLGVAAGAISVSVTTSGASETTGNPFDFKLTDSESTNFFVVSDGVNTFFTRSGSYYVDGNGYLCMTSTGYTLMGWQVDSTTGEIKKDTVTPLQVMSVKNQTSSPEATTAGTVSGILDKNDANLKGSDDGYIMSLNFYDDLGYGYTARLSVKPKGTGEGEDTGKYNVSLLDVLDSNAKSIIYDEDGFLLDPAITPETLFSTEQLRQAVDENGKTLYQAVNENGEFLYQAVDANGKLLYQAVDEDGNLLYQQVDAETGELMVDENGNPVTTTTNTGYPIQTLTDSGYPIQTTTNTGYQIQITTDTGYPVYADEDWNVLTFMQGVPEGSKNPDTGYYKYNNNGKICIYPAETIRADQETGVLLSQDGRPVEPLEAGDYYTYKEAVLNSDGTPQLDDNGNPKYNTIISERYYEPYEMIFDTNEGDFISINGADAVTLKMSLIQSNYTNAISGRNSEFQDISIDFSGCLNLNNGGTSTMGAMKGFKGTGAGKTIGALTGISVDNTGKIYGTYDNGNTQLLGQISVAQFSNASGLEKIGNNCYQTSLISGEFDGIGIDISADGSSISTGELEMSNVDLAAQFTDMIITQRGFQANSRVISTTDSLLEELINLKR